MERNQNSLPAIKIIAALISDEQGRVLLVRKRGTEFFMQPGGKIDPGELASETLAREIEEELGCKVVHGSEEYLGNFVAEAANEPGHMLEAELYRLQIGGDPQPLAEIEELIWVFPGSPDHLKLAPFTRDSVLPIA